MNQLTTNTKVVLARTVYQSLTGFAKENEITVMGAAALLAGFVNAEIENERLKASHVLVTTGIDMGSDASILKGLITFAVHNYLEPQPTTEFLQFISQRHLLTNDIKEFNA